MGGVTGSFEVVKLRDRIFSDGFSYPHRQITGRPNPPWHAIFPIIVIHGRKPTLKIF
jgi:hypothetical protein